MHSTFADIRTSERDLAWMHAIGAMASLESGDALAQADRVAAETLIRTTIQVLASGSPVKDLDGLVQRNAGRVSLADIRAGRLGSNVLGDIIGTVEQAKGNTNFNWHAATPEQMRAHLIANGFDPTQAQRLLGGTQVASAEKPGAARDDSGGRAKGAGAPGDYAGIVGNFGVGPGGTLTGFTSQMYASQFRPLGYNEPTAKAVAGILGKSEGLRGEALVARTKEVAKDTKDKLGLDVNKYAKDVATVGKEYSDPAIEYKRMLDRAAQLRAAGQAGQAQQIEQQAGQFKKRQVDKATQHKPKIVPSLNNIYRGLNAAGHQHRVRVGAAVRSADLPTRVAALESEGAKPPAGRAQSNAEDDLLGSLPTATASVGSPAPGTPAEGIVSASAAPTTPGSSAPGAPTGGAVSATAAPASVPAAQQQTSVPAAKDSEKDNPKDQVAVATQAKPRAPSMGA